MKIPFGVHGVKVTSRRRESETLICDQCHKAYHFEPGELKRVTSERVGVGWSIRHVDSRLGSPGYPICPECTEKSENKGVRNVKRTN